jgi:hypothetical protein
VSFLDEKQAIKKIRQKGFKEAKDDFLGHLKQCLEQHTTQKND